MARRFVAAALAALALSATTTALAQSPPPPAPPPKPTGALSSEDTETTPAPNAVPVQSDLPFYRGPEKIVKPVIVPPQDNGIVIAGLFHLEQMIVPETRGDASIGTLFDTSLYLGAKGVGFMAGYSNLAGLPGFNLGLSLGRFGKGSRLFDASGWIGSIVPPTFDVILRGFVPKISDDVIPAISASSDLVGFRVAKCLGSSTFHVALHLPSVSAGAIFLDQGALRDSDDPLGYFSIGGTLEAGMVF